MTEQVHVPQAPPPHADDPSLTPTLSSDPNTVLLTKPGEGWDGPTYYGRPQLKKAPFNNWVVGAYIFLAGLSGASALVGALASRHEHGRPTLRRGRYLSLLAPTLGSALLVWDLHSPKRFYNMMRVAKATSPMSIGTWTLLGFTGFAGIAAAVQFITDRVPGAGWLRGLGRAAQVPAAATGAVLSTYTAALLAATSIPIWAAAPRSLAARFGASSIASGAAALAMGEQSRALRRRLDALTVGALAVELVAAQASHRAYHRTNIHDALDSGWGRVEGAGATGVGVMLPLALHTALFLVGSRREGGFARLARLAVLGGSAILRVSMLGLGDVSADRPGVSFRFSQPENLPQKN